jgi:hypothetical protein
VVDEYLRDHPGLTELRGSFSRHERQFEIELTKLPAGRELRGAVLVVPNSFPVGRLLIRVSTEHVLKVPHVESDGAICFKGDDGPGANLSPEERIDDILLSFYRSFVKPWGYGELDNDFRRECQTYWAIFVRNRSTKVDTIKAVCTTTTRPDGPLVSEAVLALPLGWVLVGTDDRFSERVLASLRERASQVVKALVVQVPIAEDFIPATWPNTSAEVEALLVKHLSIGDIKRFAPRRAPRNFDRVVIFRSPNSDFAYLMPNGPPNVKTTGKREQRFHVREVVPLDVHRVDPEWTYGRCQHPEVAVRQNKHVVVFGAGALGAHIVDQLARAGVGKISIVDPDTMQPANIGRHLLGADSLGRSKARCVEWQVGRANPACILKHYDISAEAWLHRPAATGDEHIDMFVDVTGEPSVRAALDAARRMQSVPLLIGWMEPFVAAAHVCQLTQDASWFNGSHDRLKSLQAVTWPSDVMLREPACNSEFQAYTAAAATHAVALVAEAAIELLDGLVAASTVKSWVRGQRYLDKHRNGLVLLQWAQPAAEYDGLVIERAF